MKESRLQTTLSACTVVSFHDADGSRSPRIKACGLLRASIMTQSAIHLVPLPSVFLLLLFFSPLLLPPVSERKRRTSSSSFSSQSALYVSFLFILWLFSELTILLFQKIIHRARDPQDIRGFSRDRTCL